MKKRVHNFSAGPATLPVEILEAIESELYDYEGITATSSQFYLTDSVKHFFRGSFYFDTEINDSIVPIKNFVKEDIKYLIESFSCN